MHICILTRHNPYDRNSWSGIPYHIFDELKQKHKVEWVGGNSLSFMERLLLKAYLKVFGYYKHGFYYYSYVHSKMNTRHIQKKLTKSFDLIVALNAPDYVAFLNTKVPIVYVNDATFQLFTNFYPSFFKMSEARLKEGNRIEQEAIRKARYLLYSSEWAAQSAIRRYQADDRKIRIFSFGANLPQVPNSEEMEKNEPQIGICQLLFVGKDWDRKGGQTMVRIIHHLIEVNFDFQLTVVGCCPKPELRPEQVRVIPFLDKNNEKELTELINIYSRSHLLVLPTVADCTPVVFSEAAAFGIPVITTATGGIASLIRNGVNGFMLDEAAGPLEFARAIQSTFSNKKLYNHLRSSSRHEYETKLNWRCWANRFNELVEAEM